MLIFYFFPSAACISCFILKPQSDYVWCCNIPVIVMAVVRPFSLLLRTMDLNFCSLGENKEKFPKKKKKRSKKQKKSVLLILQYFV